MPRNADNIRETGILYDPRLTVPAGTMSILDNILGSDDVDDETNGKYAIMLNAGPERAPVAGNAFNYAVELDDGGYEVLVFLDGKATK